jgi:hypothetical protein
MNFSYLYDYALVNSILVIVLPNELTVIFSSFSELASVFLALNLPTGSLDCLIYA